MSKRILCFGDSNTWGYDGQTGLRFAEDVRWTGVLQSLLGPEYTVLEEGQNGGRPFLQILWRAAKAVLPIWSPVWKRPIRWISSS